MLSAEWLERLNVSDEKAYAWTIQIKQLVNCSITHAAGRLFDSFSVLLGFAAPETTYEGQTAIRLESAARRCTDSGIPELPFSDYEHDGKLFIDWNKAFAMLADTKAFRCRETAWAMSVHHAVARAALKMVEYGTAKTGLKTVALSGGVFMNGILHDLLVAPLRKTGLKVLVHRAVPPNDGCISLGQAVIAGRNKS
jgi:hydrogenase maturation protein HypF